MFVCTRPPPTGVHGTSQNYLNFEANLCFLACSTDHSCFWLSASSFATYLSINDKLTCHTSSFQSNAGVSLTFRDDWLHLLGTLLPFLDGTPKLSASVPQTEFTTCSDLRITLEKSLHQQNSKISSFCDLENP